MLIPWTSTRIKKDKDTRHGELHEIINCDCALGTFSHEGHVRNQRYDGAMHNDWPPFQAEATSFNTIHRCPPRKSRQLPGRHSRPSDRHKLTRCSRARKKMLEKKRAKMLVEACRTLMTKSMTKRIKHQCHQISMPQASTIKPEDTPGNTCKVISVC